MTIIYKLETADEWQAAKANGVYQGSSDDKRDGFIHFSTAEQVPGTLKKHFATRPDLLLIAFDAKTLGQNLKWESSRGGALFPHLYAPLPTTHVLWEKPLEYDNNGVPSLPDNFTQI